MRALPGLAFFGPLALFSALAAPSAYWLDSGEFIAAATQLSVSHPPGSPLYVLFVKLVALLPLGSTPFRTSLASGLCAAAIGPVLYGTAVTLCRAAGVSVRAGAALSFATAILVTTSSSLGLQAVRAEVYALQALLSLGALALATRATESRSATDLLAATLCAGLSLSNHHFLALLAFPGLASAFAFALLDPKWWGTARTRFSLWATGLVALGLLPYLLLPLRANAPSAVASADSLRSFFWIVSATVYQKSHLLAQAPWGDRIADVVLLLANDLAGIGLLATLGGLYAFVRQPALRRYALLWALPTLIYPTARAWLGFIRDNPDAQGYLVPGLAAAALTSTAFAAAAWGPLSRARPSWARVALAGAVGMAIVIGPGRADRYSLANFWAAEDSLRSALDGLEPRGLLLATRFETAFLGASQSATDNERPDVTVIGVPFLSYPGHASRQVRRDPALAPLVRSILLEGTLAETELAEVAARRPTLVELDAALPRALDVYFVPDGPLVRARGEPVAPEELESGAPLHRARWATLMARIGPALPRDRQTREAVLWRRYLEALLYASRGVRELAYESATAAEEAIPGTPELRDLRLAVHKGTGPLDVTPFLPLDGRPPPATETTPAPGNSR